MEHAFWARRAARKRRREARVAHQSVEESGKTTYDVVCRYWLTGTCRMEDRCVFLHRYIPSKIPLCVYIDVGCTNATHLGCEFRHWYNEGERPLRPVSDAYRAAQAQVVAQMVTTPHPSSRSAD